MDKGGPQNGDSNWIVETKFEPSRPNIDLVNRERLIALLDAAVDKKIAFVVAPAGFGKSTLLCQWFEQKSADDMVMAWLTLDENDTDAHQFLSYAVMSLAHGGVDIGELEIGARNGFSESPPRSILNSLKQRLQAANAACILVLDDYHLVASSVIDDIVGQMILEMPANLTLVINSRTMPSLDIPNLIAAGNAIVIGPDQIRLTRDETLLALGDKITAQDASEIYKQTEGWPVAVQLARVQKRARPAEALRPASSSGLVASYLTHQVLGSVDEDVREFLLTVSVLERFNPELANAVCGHEDSWQVVKKLGPLSALLISIDLEGNWFRLHHLFAEYLRDTLRQEDPSRFDMIMSKASTWHADQGYLIEAVKYAAFASNFEKCERLILEAGGWKIILTEGIGVLRALFRLTPDRIVSSSARLLVARAYLHCKDGEYQEARGLLDVSVTLRPKSDGAAYDRDHKLIESMVNAYEDKRRWALDKTMEDPATIAAGFDALEAGTLICERMLAHFSMGKLRPLEQDMRTAFNFMRQSGSVLGLNYCYLHAGIAALYRAELEVAQANISQALELSESNFGSDSGLKHMALVLNYALKVWKGEALPSDIENFSQMLSHIESYDGWAEIYLVGLDAAFHLAEQCSDYKFAEAVTARFLKVAGNRALERLEMFCLILNLRTASRLGQTNEVKTISAQIKDWMINASPSADPRAWQSYILAARTLSELGLMPPDQVIDALLLAENYVKDQQARLHQVRLYVAKSIALKNLGRKDDSTQVLVQAIRIAAPQKMMGPFLCDVAVKKLLKDALSYFHSNDFELVLINFVTEIFARSDQLRPRLANELLSARELEILEQLSIGKANKEIARRFELTENTVKFHLKNIYSKLAVNSRTQAIIAANKMKLLD